MKLTLAKVLARKYQQVVLYLTLCPPCLLITFANSLDQDQARRNVGPDLDPKLFDTRMVWKKPSIQRVKYGTIIKCEGILKAILENPKADQNTLFCKYVFF